MDTSASVSEIIKVHAVYGVCGRTFPEMSVASCIRDRQDENQPAGQVLSFSKVLDDWIIIFQILVNAVFRNRVLGPSNVNGTECTTCKGQPNQIKTILKALWFLRLVMLSELVIFHVECVRCSPEGLTDSCKNVPKPQKEKRLSHGPLRGPRCPTKSEPKRKSTDVLRTL